MQIGVRLNTARWLLCNRMAEYVESEEEKQELYKKNRGVIEELENAIEQYSKKFEDTWGYDLANVVPNSKIIDIPELPGEDHEHSATAIEIELDGGETERWFFYSESPNFLPMVKKGWWKSGGSPEEKEFWDNGYTMGKTKDSKYINYRVQLRFSLKYDAEGDNWFNEDTPTYEMLLKSNLQIELTGGSKSVEGPFSDDDRKFRTKFKNKMKNSFDSEKYPKNAKKAGGVNPIKIVRNIPLEEHENFHEALIDALSEVFNEIARNNRSLVSDVDKALEEIKKEKNGIK